MTLAITSRSAATTRTTEASDSRRHPEVGPPGEPPVGPTSRAPAGAVKRAARARRLLSTALLVLVRDLRAARTGPLRCRAGAPRAHRRQPCRRAGRTRSPHPRLVGRAHRARSGLGHRPLVRRRSPCAGRLPGQDLRSFADRIGLLVENPRRRSRAPDSGGPGSGVVDRRIAALDAEIDRLSRLRAELALRTYERPLTPRTARRTVHRDRWTWPLPPTASARHGSAAVTGWSAVTRTRGPRSGRAPVPGPPCRYRGRPARRSVRGSRRRCARW